MRSVDHLGSRRDAGPGVEPGCAAYETEPGSPPTPHGLLVESRTRTTRFGGACLDPPGRGEGVEPPVGIEPTRASFVDSPPYPPAGAIGVPCGSRTRVARVRTGVPRPLAERDMMVSLRGIGPRALRLEGASAEPPRGRVETRDGIEPSRAGLQSAHRKPSDRVRSDRFFNFRSLRRIFLQRFEVNVLPSSRSGISANLS